MITKLFQSIFGTSNSRQLKLYAKTVQKINELEPSVQALSDKALQEKTTEFQTRLQQGESLDDLLPEAFAVCREASVRVLGMRHFDVQLMGGIALHDGKIAEMGTGEGKTLVATLAAYLNALPGTGVHVVTVNDYLAQRDSESMGRIYQYLGLSVGVILSDQLRVDKYDQYEADITYGTNNEFGFDYLRDNMAFSSEERRQRGHAFAIVDEVDSILIDEARTPLIISGPSDDKVEIYAVINKIAPKLTRQWGEIDKEGVPSPDYKAGDYLLDEKNRSVTLSDQGHESVEKQLHQLGLLQQGENVYDAKNIYLMQNVNASVRAHTLYEKNRDYIIEENEIVIIDEFTGRKMKGRRWSDGLHQAIEAKEGVAIQNENQTLASITFQNYFRLYGKLSGMTGTADTEALEFQQIYNLSVVVIPANRPVTREDEIDVVYLTTDEKFTAMIESIRTIHDMGQPILVGTASIDTSERLSKAMKQAGIAHEVLNAKQHEREASIIAQAGQVGAVTIATNMAGRGTDIVLGGNVDFEITNQGIVDKDKIAQARALWQQQHDRVIELGGLCVIGTERHESRRVDNQLRGRSGRQGDPGRSVFYLSLEDDLMRIFASDKMRGMMQKLGLNQGEAIAHSWVTKAIANAQKKVEGRNFEVRKQLLEYDNVVNEQRKVIYQQRNDIMSQDNWAEYIQQLRHEDVYDTLDIYIPEGSIDELWDIQGLQEALREEYNIQLPIQQWLDEDDLLAETGVKKRVLSEIEQVYADKEVIVGTQVVRHFEKAVLLQVLDGLWKSHLGALDYLRQGIHLRGYAQRNPVQEYKKEAFEMFSEMLDNIRHDVIKILCFVELKDEQDIESVNAQRQQSAAQTQPVFAQSPTASSETPLFGASQSLDNTFQRDERKIGRNEPCPCGSGKKYKHCHGKN